MKKTIIWHKFGYIESTSVIQNENTSHCLDFKTLWSKTLIQDINLSQVWVHRELYNTSARVYITLSWSKKSIKHKPGHTGRSFKTLWKFHPWKIPILTESKRNRMFVYCCAFHSCPSLAKALVSQGLPPVAICTQLLQAPLCKATQRTRKFLSQMFVTSRSRIGLQWLQAPPSLQERSKKCTYLVSWRLLSLVLSFARKTCTTSARAKQQTHKFIFLLLAISRT